MGTQGKKGSSATAANLPAKFEKNAQEGMAQKKAGGKN